jgi:hypothetical protein
MKIAVATAVPEQRMLHWSCRLARAKTRGSLSTCWLVHSRSGLRTVVGAIVALPLHLG